MLEKLKNKKIQKLEIIKTKQKMCDYITWKYKRKIGYPQKNNSWL